MCHAAWLAVFEAHKQPLLHCSVLLGSVCQSRLCGSDCLLCLPVSVYAAVDLLQRDSFLQSLFIMKCVWGLGMGERAEGAKGNTLANCFTTNPQAMQLTKWSKQFPMQPPCAEGCQVQVVLQPLTVPGGCSLAELYHAKYTLGQAKAKQRKGNDLL